MDALTDKPEEIMTIGTIITSAGAWIWGKYGEAILKDAEKKAQDEVRKKWDEFRWIEASNKYRERVRELYSTTRVLGNPRPISLEGTFTEICLLSNVSASLRYDIERLKAIPPKRFSEEVGKSRKNALELVAKERNLFILGKPGAGKTTLLKYIALLASRDKINKVPIFISMKEWSDSQMSLIDFIAKQFEICDFPTPATFISHLLKTGNAIFLFDGLDEVSENNSQRASVITDINNFANQHAKCQHLVTCRIAAVNYSFEHFTYAEIADLNKLQIKSLVRKWFGENKTKSKKFLQELNRKQNEGLYELAQIPLLLVLLCLGSEETMSFPQRRVEIYEEAIDALIKKWDASRNIKRDDFYRKLSLGRKRQMFSRIAYDTFRRGEYFIRQDHLEKRIVSYCQNLPPIDQTEDIDGNSILKSIESQHGILVERAYKIYSFSHLSVQEYFAAKYITENLTEGTLEHLFEHFTDDRWHEVFLLVASLLDNADKFFETMIQRVNSQLIYDEKLITALHWAEEKANCTYKELDYPSPALARALALVSLMALSHALTYTRAVAYVKAYSSSPGDREHIAALNKAVTLFQILDLDFARRQKTLLAKRRDRNLVRELSIALQRSGEIKSADFDSALMSLPIAAKKNQTATWKTFNKNLGQAITETQNLGKAWDLSLPQFRSLVRYIDLNIMLLDGLRVAYVSDRSAIENGLLLAPDSKALSKK
jgi:hypothetical protein